MLKIFVDATGKTGNFHSAPTLELFKCLLIKSIFVEIFATKETVCNSDAVDPLGRMHLTVNLACRPRLMLCVDQLLMRRSAQ